MSSKRVVVSLAVPALVVFGTGWYAASAFPLTTRAVAVAGSGFSRAEPALGAPEGADLLVGQTVRQPKPAARKRLTHVDAVYPVEAATIKASGLVTLVATIDKTGNVTETRLVNVSVSPVWAPGTTANQSRGVAEALVDAATAALQQWKYDSGAEPGTVRVVFRFNPERGVAQDMVPGPPPPPPPPPKPGSSAGVFGGVGADVGGGVGGGVSGVVVSGFVGGVPTLEQVAEGSRPPYRIGGAMKPPQKIVHVEPVYPADARAARVQGVVIIETTIDEAGNVSDAKMLRSIPLLDQAALEAVKQWKYTPTLLNGAAVPVIMTVTVNFRLDGEMAKEVAPTPAGSTGLISLDFENADLLSVLRIFAREGNVDLVVDPTVSGKVNLTLKNVTWQRALDTVLRAHKLTYSLDGTTIHIAQLR